MGGRSARLLPLPPLTQTPNTLPQQLLPPISQVAVKTTAAAIVIALATKTVPNAKFSAKLPALLALTAMPTGLSLLFSSTTVLVATGIAKYFPINYYTVVAGSYICLRLVYLAVCTIDRCKEGLARVRGIEFDRGEASKDQNFGTAALAVVSLLISVSGAIPNAGFPIISFVG